MPLRILLAEDNAINQKLALLMLERLGYRADVAGQWSGGAGGAATQAYDVVLMDVQMPEMDGLEATRRIRRQMYAGGAAHIIAMTANAMKGDRSVPGRRDGRLRQQADPGGRSGSGAAPGCREPRGTAPSARCREPPAIPS